MKQNKGFGLIGIIVIIIITAITASITTGVIMLNSKSSSLASVSKDENLQEFISVYETLLSKYYDEIDKEAMLNAAEEGMLNFLGDKYTTYLDNSEYKDIIDDLSSTYEGIGVTILNNVVQDVTALSPASKAGILAGDVITKVNSIDVQNMSSAEIGDLIKNGKEKTVYLEINRNGEVLNFTVNKEKLDNPTISYHVIEGTSIGYLAITKFSDKLGSQISKGLKELENNGITSLIVDVRDNVGGYLTSAEDAASLFIEEGKVIYSLKSNNNSEYTYQDKTKEKREYPIVVLINGNSASASEILAAALKDSYNATLVGTTSYGKGKVQQVAELENGDSVKYTSAKWYTPNGVCIDEIGISPDYYVEMGEDGVDAQLNKAIDILSTN